MLRLFLLSCPSLHLGRALDLLNSCELVLSVHQRLEGKGSRLSASASSSSGGSGSGSGTGTGVLATGPSALGSHTPRQQQQQQQPHHQPAGTITASTIKTSLRTSGNIAPLPAARAVSEREREREVQMPPLQISGTTFLRDGILMPPAQVWGPLLLFLMAEVKRRLMPDTDTDTDTPPPSQDIEHLVGILQRSENHLLAIRVLLTSWASYPSKKQVSLYMARRERGRVHAYLSLSVEM